MNILILGAGGREHALSEIYSKSKSVKKVFVLPGNGLIDFKNEKIKLVSNIDSSNVKNIISFCKKQKIDHVDVSSDDPIAKGFVDSINNAGIYAFGPSKDSSEIEWSKEWARYFMQKYKLPIPKFKVFNDQKKAIKYVNLISEQPLFIKASGLAAGKGAIRADNKKEAISAISSMKSFGKAGETFLIEECMIGEEFSLFAICDGKNYKIIKTAQDHKTVYDADQGPNTGGMGCTTPARIISPKLLNKIELEILKPFMEGMQKENRPYTGILYLGGMLTKKGVRIVEFNARWGDPEAQVILPGIKTDYIKIINAVREQKLNKLKIVSDRKTRISIAGCSRGYPNDYSEIKNKEIYGLNLILKSKNAIIYGAGIKRKNNKFFANGGRIFHLVSEGENILETRKNAYYLMSSIYIQNNGLHYRTDIGWRDIERILK
jgi:phosphoribosylamine--glycine ligase